jgi:hypothetical protein
VSVSGYSLPEWNRLWQAALLDVPPRDPRAERGAPASTKNPRELAKRTRLGDLLSERGADKAALALYDEALALGPSEPWVRFRAAWASLTVADGDAKGWRDRLGKLSDVRAAHGGWLALEGRRQHEDGALEGLTTQGHALGLDPLTEEVACEGQQSKKTAPVWPTNPDRRKLCEAVREAKTKTR